MIFLSGMLLSGSMIMAIGAQNAHVIKSGLSGNNIFYTSLTCFLCDFFLMVFGVFFIGKLTSINYFINIFICILSIAFLLFYAFNSFKQALISKKTYELHHNKLLSHTPIWKTIVTTLAITLLNPHVYLDTVIIVGGYSSSLTTSDKYFFISGALLSSFCWFFSLGYLSRYFKKYLNNYKTWKIFNIFICFFMLFIAINIGNFIIKI